MTKVADPCIDFTVRHVLEPLRDADYKESIERLARLVLHLHVDAVRTTIPKEVREAVPKEVELTVAKEVTPFKSAMKELEQNMVKLQEGLKKGNKKLNEELRKNHKKWAQEQNDRKACVDEGVEKAMEFMSGASSKYVRLGKLLEQAVLTLTDDVNQLIRQSLCQPSSAGASASCSDCGADSEDDVNPARFTCRDVRMDMAGWRALKRRDLGMERQFVPTGENLEEAVRLAKHRAYLKRRGPEVAVASDTGKFKEEPPHSDQ